MSTFAPKLAETLKRLGTETAFEVLAKAMTGWRSGYGVMCKRLITAVNRLVTICYSWTASFFQRACIDALEGLHDEVERLVEKFRKRRDFLVKGLNSIKNVTCQIPKGAFYAFLNISKIGMSCRPFSEYLVNEHGVATLCGVTFGEYGEDYLKLSYANLLKNIEIALERIAKAVLHIS